MAKRQRARSAGEASVPTAPLSSERERLEAAVASLSGLNADQLRLQWRNHLGGISPAHLPGWLLARVLGYRIQAAAFGDLDQAILRRLRERKGEVLGQARPFATRGPTTREGVGLRSGALLVREWNGDNAANLRAAVEGSLSLKRRSRSSLDRNYRANIRTFS